MYRYLKLHLLIRSNRLKFFILWICHTFRFRHLSLRLDPIIGCNLSCLMCYFSDTDYRRNNKGRMSPEQAERIAKIMFPSALQVVLGCATEPTLYKDYVGLVKLARKMKVPTVSLTTNGQLITREKIKELIAAGLSEITLSVHGTSKERYEKFMPGATYDRLIEFLTDLRDEKKKAGSSIPHLRMNFTANPENVYELADFYKVFGSFDIHLLQIRPVMNIGGVYKELFTTEADIAQYKKVVQQLKKESKTHKVTLLANIVDVQYAKESENTPLLESVYRYISPEVVWERDFHWQTEDYYQYCKRIGWHKWLWKNIFSSQKSQESSESFLKKYSGRYEVVS